MTRKRDNLPNELRRLFDASLAVDAAHDKAARLIIDQAVGYARQYLSQYRYELLDQLRRQATKQARTTILPDNVKFFVESPNQCLVVLQEPPKVRTLNFSWDFCGIGDKEALAEACRAGNTNPVRFRLAFPYVVFLVACDWHAAKEQWTARHLFVMYVNKPLEGTTDQLYKPNLPNLFEGCLVCTGSKKLMQAKSLAALTKRVVGDFWSSVFNNDTAGHYTYMAERDARFQTVEDWQEHSTRNPLFVLDVKWFAHGTLDAVVNSVASSTHMGRQSDDTEELDRYLQRLCNQAANAAMQKVLLEGARVRNNVAYASRTALEAALTEINEI